MKDKEKKSAVLNLDEFFGKSEPIVVRWQNKEYALKRPDAMGPVEFIRFSKVQERVSALNGVRAELTETEAHELRKLTADMLITLSRELGEADLPFLAQMKVLEFYGHQVNPPAEKKLPPTSKPIGETSTPASASGTV